MIEIIGVLLGLAILVYFIFTVGTHIVTRHVLRDTERKQLRAPHNLQQQKVGSKEDLPMDFTDWKISICYRDRKDPFPYKHYFLKLFKPDSSITQQKWKLEFSLNLDDDKGEVTLVKSFKQQEEKEEETQNVTDDIVGRIVSVLYATNFSYCLRNSENFANYIFDGTWQSHQLTQNKYMRKIFDDILSIEDREKLSTLPLDIANRIYKKEYILFPEMEGMLQFVNRTNLRGFRFPEDDYNIIVVGPTGAGKSTLINLLFNRTVCVTNRKDKFNFAAVTRNAQVVTGIHLCQDKEVRVNVVDTMGFCDTFLENKEVADILFRDILSEHSKIDKVVFVTYGVISAAHQDAIIQIMDRFEYPRKYPDLTEKRDNFVFLYNKTEKMTDDEKLKKLKDMGEKLGADIGHKIPVMMLVPGMEETGLKQKVFAKSALATGVNCDGELDVTTKKTFKELKAALLPQTREVLMSPKRLNIAQMQCLIQ